MVVQVARKQYTLTVQITEGSDEFWESLTRTGCDDVMQAVQRALHYHGFQEPDTTVVLTRYEQVF